MNSYFSRAVGYICIAAVVMFALSRCGTQLSDAATQAHAANCTANSKVQKIRMTSGQIDFTCEDVAK